jgi:uncharacterized small protein (DUF1192 family)
VDITHQDILVILIQKEKTIAALTQQAQALAKEIDRLNAELAAPKATQGA